MENGLINIKMEIAIKLPNELCERIIASEFELDVGEVTEELISKTIDLYVVPLLKLRKPQPSTRPPSANTFKIPRIPASTSRDEHNTTSTRSNSYCRRGKFRNASTASGVLPAPPCSRNR